MSDSTFNAEQFLGTTTTDIGDTKYFPCPIGEWPGQVGKVEAKKVTSTKSGTEATYFFLEVHWNILDENCRKMTETGADKPLVVRQSLILDLTPAGGLDFGKNKNVPLSRLREALGQQRKGKAWGPAHLIGGMAKVLVIHEPREDTGDPVARVKSVIAAS